MLLNRGNRGWIIVCAVLFIIATVAYVPYAMNRPHGPSGGSVIGLVYGISGTAMMVFALLLAVRKKFRSARIGRTYHWLQGHVWLGMLSYPIILFHAGFRFNGSPMGMALMLLFAIVFISGVVGLIAQQYIPNKLVREVPGESIYEQIPHVLNILQSQAKAQMQALRKEVTTAASSGGGTATMAPPKMDVGIGELESLYKDWVEPYLQDELPKRTPFVSAESTGDLFRRLERRLPDEMAEPLDTLRSIVEERRQLEKQRKLHRLMNAWLMVHVPVSYGLMLLVAVHIVVAIKYGIPAS